jgi:hypothetical protein
VLAAPGLGLRALQLTGLAAAGRRAAQRLCTLLHARCLLLCLLLLLPACVQRCTAPSSALQQPPAPSSNLQHLARSPPPCRWLTDYQHLRYMWLPYTDSAVVVRSNPLRSEADAAQAAAQPAFTEEQRLAPLRGGCCTSQRGLLLAG